MRGDKPGFFEELKRRHVWRVAIAYVVTAWILLQLTSIVLPGFGAPAWVLKVLMLVFVIFFPLAVLLAWALEITPEGIRRTPPADSPDVREPHVTREMARKLNNGILAALTIAVALLAGNQFIWHKGMDLVPPAPVPAKTASAATSSLIPSVAPPAAIAAVPLLPVATAAILRKSVAVLPFVNEGERSQQFFSDGLSESLINALSQFDGLKVISRHSAFQFRDSKETSANIGRLLGVAHLLEGSVQRAQDEVRITATLVNAADGSIVWSQRYDEPYTDLFDLQDAITQAVASALKAKLLSAPGAVTQSERPPSGNLEAYNAYQHGKAYAALGTEVSYRRATAAYHDAIRLDPKYAAAYARLSQAWAGLAAQWLAGQPMITAYAKAREAADTALNFDADFALAHKVRAGLLLNADFDWTGSTAEYRRALQLAPNDAETQSALGSALATLGQVRQAADLTGKALVADPLHAGWYNWLSLYLSALGQADAALQASTTAIALQPGAAAYHEQLALVEILRGEPDAALAAARQEPPGIWHDIAMALALQVGADRAAADAALQAFSAKYAEAAAYQVAQMYALRRDPETMFQWLDRAWTNRDPGVGLLLYDPFILRYRADPRFTAFCKKVGLPTTTDAVAMK